MIEVAACVHFLSDGNHRARGAVDNWEGVLWRTDRQGSLLISVKNDGIKA